MNGKKGPKPQSFRRVSLGSYRAEGEETGLKSQFFLRLGVFALSSLLLIMLSSSGCGFASLLLNPNLLKSCCLNAGLLQLEGQACNHAVEERQRVPCMLFAYILSESHRGGGIKITKHHAISAIGHNAE